MKIRTRSRRKRQQRRHRGPHMQCGICKHVVQLKSGQGSPAMMNHEPIHGDIVSDNVLPCIGMNFPNMMIPIV